MEYILPDKYKKLRSVKDFKAKIRHECLKTSPVGCVKFIVHMLVATI